jgi:hypothetical protein
MRISWLSLLPIALCLPHGAAWPQAIPKPYPADRYLPQLVAAERATSGLPSTAFGNTRTPELDDAIRKLRHAFEDLGAQRAFIGDTEGAIGAFDLLERASAPRGSGKEQAAPDGVEADDAIRAIVEQARSKRVVLINEAHHVPMNRAFTQKLAAELRKIGYSYLACEAFSSEGGDMSKRAPGLATVYTGYYVRDPVFAGFVNAALADGWKLVPYEYEERPKPGEDPRQHIDAREQAQARNLVERIFAKDKNAKVLIHVGYGHLEKSKPDDKENRLVLMGEHLHRMTGLDMLHVDQTRFYAHPDRAGEARMYAALVEKFPSQEPFVLRTADGGHPFLLGMQGRVDMQVIFPRYANHDGRPDWLRTLAGRSPIPVPAELLPTQGRRLIKAFRVGDRPDAVPADIVLVEAGMPAPALMLPPGEFRYAYEDEGS